jgi:DNA-binding transcriptional regulator YiaG
MAIERKEPRLHRGSAAKQIDTEHVALPGYARIVEEVRDGGLSTSDVARVVGVAERQVRNWTSGGNAPSGRNRDQLLELHYVTRMLRDVYTREGAEIWLHGRKRSLDGRRPIDLLADGAYDEVLDAIERLHAGAM